MKYAFYPGCVAQGAAPELYNSTIEVCRKLGIELDAESMQSASCTGAGVLQEKNQRLGDTLNRAQLCARRTLGLPLLTICSTCQGVMSQANQRLTADADYLSSVNEDLAEEGLEYKGTADPKHLLWIIVEDIGIDKLKSMVVRPLTGFKAAPFYGCYLVRQVRRWDLQRIRNAWARWSRSSRRWARLSLTFRARRSAAAFPFSPSTRPIQ
ncbi:CoB--CoM heterodisulfide reductase subunit B 2 [Geodia barretti]|uniref:CoB--CoM heterodisulfide reductase subunit B 2 n=1 Tax=Geodia barretti TaxID=519541 RepID=A0AA35TSY0_GEOBA|nr:CoB--CoM heterodisulfide reductase subunit B 2 [Geodia barretti]